jgi:predicted RNA-binding Zn-ribbon protein involved in translation (DUF1610 family)
MMNLHKDEKETLHKYGYSDEAINELRETSMTAEELKRELKDIYDVPISHMDQEDRKVFPCPYCGQHTVFRKIACEAFTEYFCSRCAEVKA